MKKFLIILTCLVLCITVTGCGKEKQDKDKESKENIEYIREIDMSTFKKASKSKEDDFIVFVYSSGIDNQDLIIDEITDYANENKRTIYFLNLDDYIKKESRKATDEDYEAYKNETCVPILDDDTEEVIAEAPTEEVCQDDFELYYENKILSDFLGNYGIDDANALLYFHTGNFLGSFSNYIPYGAFTLLDEDEQKETLEKANKQLKKWLNEVFKMRDENVVKEEK